MNIVEGFARQALAHPNAVALVTGERETTAGELLALVQRMAAQLARHGVQPGDRVTITVHSVGVHVALSLAIAWIGAVSIPAGLATIGLARELGARFVVQPRREGREPQPAVGGQEDIDLDSLLRAPAADVPPMYAAGPDEIWRIGLSSGTTGLPKAFRQTHSSAILRAAFSRLVVRAAAHERLMILLGAGIAYASSYWLRALYNAGVLVVPPGTADTRDPDAVLQEIRDREVTLLLSSPADAIELARRAQAPGSRFSKPPPRLKALALGGASVSPGACQSLQRHLTPNVFMSYGASETGVIAVLTPAMQAEHPGCAGRLVPWVEAQVVDDAGQVLPAGRKGNIRLRAPGLAAGYEYPKGTPPEEPRAFREGWFHSGDVGTVLADGRIFLGGRMAEVLNLGGNKIEPTVVEEVIARDPSIVDCAVVAVPGRLGDVALTALVVAPQAVDRKALKERCAAVLGRALAPRSVVQVEALPRNAGGKLEREKLAELARAAKLRKAA